MKKILFFSMLLGGAVLAQPLSSPTRALTQAEVKAVLSSVCDGKIDASKGTCFPKKSFYSQIERDPKSLFRLDQKALRGSFSKAGATQVVASGDFLDADGVVERFTASLSVLLENNKVLRTSQDGGSSTCLVFARQDKRDGLICTTQSFGQGNLETFIDWRDLGVGAKTLDLLYVVDNTAGGCGNPATTFTIGKLERKDTNNDQFADLMINLEYKTAPNPNCDVDWKKVTGTNFALVFLWDGKTFKPDAKTSKVISDNGWKL